MIQVFEGDGVDHRLPKNLEVFKGGWVVNGSMSGINDAYTRYDRQRVEEGFKKNWKRVRVDEL